MAIRRLVPALTLAAACRGDAPSASIDLATTRYDPHPEAPAILRDVAMIDDDRQYTHPFVP